MEQSRGVAASCKRRRILIAHDNADAAWSLASILEAEGHAVRIVFDGARAVQAAVEQSPNIIFMDLGMAQMDGIEAALQIRALPHGKTTNGRGAHRLGPGFGQTPHAQCRVRRAPCEACQHLRDSACA